MSAYVYRIPETLKWEFAPGIKLANWDTYAAITTVFMEGPTWIAGVGIIILSSSCICVSWKQNMHYLYDLCF
jgi:hypothetical protein